jgi:taurine dioxygenase
MTQDLRFEPLTASFGALVHGLVLGAAPPEDTIEQVYRGLLDHRVLFFPDQDPAPEALLAFGRRFGPLAPRHPLFPCVEGHDEIMVILDEATKPPENEVWHSDLSGKPNPPFAAVLQAKELPPAGGDTLWCDMHAVYEALSAPMKGLLEGLSAVHDVPAAFRPVSDKYEGRAEALETMPAAEYRARHPVVMRHPSTGRPLLYVNRGFTTRIEELSEPESRMLLDHLFVMVERPRFQLRNRWRPGTVAMWDNWATQHLAVGDHYPQRRVMHRVTIADDARKAEAVRRAS